MRAPPHPITLTPAQILELSAKLATLRHNINNQLSLVVAVTELIRGRPDMAGRFVDSLSGPPQKITDEIRSFSDELEKVLEITREPAK